MLEGITQNGEAGNPAQQLSLVLDTLEIWHTKEQLAALGVFMSLHMQHRLENVGQVTHVLITDLGKADGAPAASPEQSQTCG